MANAISKARTASAAGRVATRHCLSDRDDERCDERRRSRGHGQHQGENERFHLCPQNSIASSSAPVIAAICHRWSGRDQHCRCRGDGQRQRQYQRLHRCSSSENARCAAARIQAVATRPTRRRPGRTILVDCTTVRTTTGNRGGILPGPVLTNVAGASRDERGAGVRERGQVPECISWNLSQ